jgi:hypothetical protein
MEGFSSGRKQDFLSSDRTVDVVRAAMIVTARPIQKGAAVALRLLLIPNAERVR